MKIFLIFTILMISGCDYYEIKMKCEDGVLYAEYNGAWVQALGYKNNKCLPMKAP